jgi:hypothetical protein
VGSGQFFFMIHRIIEKNTMASPDLGTGVNIFVRAIITIAIIYAIVLGGDGIDNSINHHICVLLADLICPWDYHTLNEKKFRSLWIFYSIEISSFHIIPCK